MWSSKASDLVVGSFFDGDFFFYILSYIFIWENITMVKHIIFDFFGVIVDVGTVHEHEFWSKHFGIDKEILDPIVDKYRDEINRWRMSISDFRKHIHKELNIQIKDDPYELFYATLKDVFVYQDVIDLIKSLKSQWYTCTLLSDVFAPDAERVRAKWWYDIFDDLILSCEVGLSKYHDVHNDSHDIFSYALNKYNLNPDDAIFVDDTEANCDAANRAGIRTVLATSPEAIIAGVKSFLAQK
jgi:HAD superfamily hydrolase (TIGR01509 family)